MLLSNSSRSFVCIAVVLGISACGGKEGQPCAKPEDCRSGLTCYAETGTCQTLDQINNKAPQTLEAKLSLRKLYDASISYYFEEKQFPQSITLTPSADPCASGGVVVPQATTFAFPTWQALNFSVDDPFRYRYEYVSAGTGQGAQFTARAVGDLDCDGVFSTFERSGRVQGESVLGDKAGERAIQPLE